jgi:hypothetical protein
VTVAVDRLTSETYEEEDLSGIPDLVEVIKLQASGPAEAARAIRKKLKYGNVHRQIRALVLLDGLIQNAGPRFQRTFADEPLLERLRVCGTSDLSDPEVRKKCSELFRGWAAEYKNTPGLERVAALYKVSKQQTGSLCFRPLRRMWLTSKTGAPPAKASCNPRAIQSYQRDRKSIRRRRRRRKSQANSGSQLLLRTTPAFLCLPLQKHVTVGQQPLGHPDNRDGQLLQLP